MPQFWKVRNNLFWERRVLQNSLPKVGRLFSTFLLPPELIWGYQYARGLKYHLPFRGPIRLTNYSFHTHVLYYITFHYHCCSIDKYRNVKYVKCYNFGRLGISHFEKEKFWKTNPKSCKSFLHIPSPKWTDLRFPYARGLWYHLPFRGPIRMINYNFHAHVQYCITIHYLSCSIDIYRNVKDVKCHNVGKLGISHFEKAGHLSSGQLDLTLYHSSLP